ncbi:MAG: hypothetical protein JNN08_04360 [Bryobacterales bacterium]|nr:hypothetical protein [Bryobacterales bacterium]
MEVNFVGFRCEEESDWDQASGSDEPYFIIGLVSTNGSKVVKFGPYDSVDSGTVRIEGGQIADSLTPPVFLAVVAMEHDWGSDEEAEEKVRKAILEVEKKLDEAAAAFMGASPDNHVLPEFMRDILIGWVPEGVTALFGLGDDQVGKNSEWLFPYKAGLVQEKQYPVKGQLDQHGYTHELKIDGGSQGAYKLYFNVMLWKKELV